VDWTGRLADHLLLTQVTLSPTHLQVIGGSQLLGSLSTVYTEPVPLDQIKESGMLEVKPSLSSAMLKLAAGAKDRIKIRYVVQPREPAGARE
jgi:YbbR domain-containing protein